MKVKILNEIYSKREWITSVLVNDENASDEEMLQYFIENGLSQAEAEKVMAQRNDALKDPLHFELKESKPWRKNGMESFDVKFQINAEVTNVDHNDEATEYRLYRDNFKKVYVVYKKHGYWYWEQEGVAFSKGQKFDTADEAIIDIFRGE
jgi:hypothetical protein